MLMIFFYGLLTTGYHKGNILLRPKSIKTLPPTGHATILHHTEVRHGPPDYYGFYAAVRYYRTTIQVYAWGIKGMSTAFSTVTARSNVSEYRPAEVRPSDTFDLMHIDLPAQSTYRKSTSFRSTYRSIRPNGFDAAMFYLTSFDLPI